MKKLFLLAAALVAAVTVSQAQESNLNWALKTNGLTYFIGAVSVAAEVEVAPQITIEGEIIGTIFSPWNKVGKTGLKLKGVDVIAEGRYYLTETFNGHHFGGFLEGCYFGTAKAPAPYGSAEHKKVWVIGLGASYGYALQFNEHWGLDGTVGLGLGYGSYEGREKGTLLPIPRASVAVSYKF